MDDGDDENMQFNYDEEEDGRMTEGQVRFMYKHHTKRERGGYVSVERERENFPFCSKRYRSQFSALLTIDEPDEANDTRVCSDQYEDSVTLIII